ncbi:MAG: glycosyltransferase family 39 protein [Betaproteobacteria bacterium]
MANTPLALSARERRLLVLLVAGVLLVRLVTLAAYPLTDPTEARYAEIARKMLETGRWITPQFDYGVPFWGKPPLSTWASAMTMSMFGVDEFGARLPSLLFMVGSAALVWALGVRRAGRDLGLWATVIFATTGLVFVSAGAVMTDPALTLGTTLAMAGFWGALHLEGRASRTAGLGFFVGLAVGLLAKGPVAAILTILPIGAWALWTRNSKAAISKLPWVGGGVLLAALVIPWYWAAERATPGFLDYFLVGEHWKRFTQPGWTGDLYGAAHARPRGMIWLFWLGVALPWSLAAITWLARAALVRRGDLRAIARDSWRSYFVLWSLAPMIFFTVSGNVLPSYVLPGLPALALVVADLWRPRIDDARLLRPLVRQALWTGAVLCAGFAIAIVVLRPRLENELSHKGLVREFQRQREGEPAELLYVRQQPASAAFYTRGMAKRLADEGALVPRAGDTPLFFVAIRERDLAALPANVRVGLEPAGDFGEYRLLRHRYRPWPPPHLSLPGS